MPAIELRDVTKRFLTPAGQAYTAIRDVTLSVAPGEFVAAVGPTGCGKSTYGRAAWRSWSQRCGRGALTQ